MSGTVMNFGPKWIRTLTDGGAPSTTSSSQQQQQQQPTNPNSATISSSSNPLQHQQQQIHRHNNNMNIASNANNNNNNNSSSSNNSTTSNSGNNIINLNNYNNFGISSLNNNPNSVNINASLSSSSTSSNGSNNQGKVYKLADYRYGREEMLALFDSNNEAPDDIRKLVDLFVEKARMPLSLTSMTEEEIKLTTRNWNSEAVMRASGKGITGSGGTAVSGSNPGTSGIPAERPAQDRGGPSGTATISALASSPRGPPGSLSRVPVDQRGALSTINSKSLGIRPLAGRSGPQSYPRSQFDDEAFDDGSGAYESRFSALSNQNRQIPRSRFDSATARTGVPLKPSDANSKISAQQDGDTSSDRRSIYDKLPNKYAVDNRTLRKDVNGRTTQASDWRSKEWANADGTRGRFALDDKSWRSRGADDWRGGSNPTTSWYVKNESQRGPRPAQGHDNIELGAKRDTVRRTSGSEKLSDGDEHDTQLQRRRDSIPEWSLADPMRDDNKVGSFDASGAFRSDAVRDESNAKSEDDSLANLEKQAEMMVAKWTAEEENNESANIQATGFDMIENQARKQQQNAQAKLVQNLNQAHQQQSLEQVIDANNQKEFILLPFNHENSRKWFYRDTQNVTQGPFNSTEMFEWYKMGYFVKELLIRRACDEVFYPLGEIMKMWDCIPFAPFPANIPPPRPVSATTLLQFRAAVKQLELAAAGINQPQSQISPDAFGLTHPVLLHAPIQVQNQLSSLNQNLAGQQDQQQNELRHILNAQQKQHDQNIVQRRAQQPQVPLIDPNDMQEQLRQLLVQLKDREGFANLNPQEQQSVLVRQYVARNQSQDAQAVIQRLREQQQQLLLNGGQFNQEDLLRLQQREFQQRLERQQQERQESEKQERLILEHRLRAEEEKQRIISEHQKRQEKQKEQEKEKLRELEVEKERQRLNQLKQQQLAKQKEEFRQQLQTQQQRIQQQQEEKKQQQQQAERARKSTQQDQQISDQQRKPAAWSTVGKGEQQEPISLASLQKLQEEEKEREKQSQLQAQIQSNHQLQLQRQMTWANAAGQPKVAPVKTLAEIQKEEEERLAREKQKKVKVPVVVPNAGVWNNAASQLTWKNPGGNPEKGQSTNSSTGGANNSTGASSVTTLVGKAGKKGKASSTLQVQF